ncbi:F-box and leucine-rich repeat protein 2/20 [Microdochium nivale]|nr:F-box and leucine-rich repeat protein 2/20 [Microdochium nivale]
MASTAAILQLPNELLVKILTYLLPPQIGVHFSATQHSQSARLATRLRLVSRLFHRLVEALSWRTFPTSPPSTQISYRDRYLARRGKVFATAAVPVREFVLLVNNLALARHVRSFRSEFIDVQDSRGVLATVKGRTAALLVFARETYEDAFCQFLQDLLAETSRAEYSRGAFGRKNGLVSELLTIVGLTLAHSVTDVAISVGHNFDKSPLGRFFTFCGAQRKPHSDKAGVSSGGGESTENPKFRAPLSRLRQLELTDCRERGSITDGDISSLLSFPGLESCLAWSIRIDPNPAPIALPPPAADTRNVPTLKHLELADTRIPYHGSSVALQRLLRTYPGLETLVLQSDPYDLGNAIISTATDYTGWGDVLRAHGGHLRRLDITPYDSGSENWSELVDEGTIGLLRGHLSQLEALKVPFTRLIGLHEISAAYTGAYMAAYAGVAHRLYDLGNCLPSGLRYLWLRFPSTPTHRPCSVHGGAVMSMLNTSAENMPLLEWVFVELAPETREAPFSFSNDLPPDWKHEWIGPVPNHLFRRADAEKGSPRSQGKNILPAKQHPEGWREDLVIEQLISLAPS